VNRTITLRTTVPDGARGRRLDEFAGAWLTQALVRGLSRSAVRRLIIAGVVRVDGRRTRRPSLLLEPGQRIDAAPRLAEIERSARDVASDLGESQIVFEDPWLVAVDKPSGMPFHKTADPSRPDLVSAVRRLLAARPGGPPQPYLGVHQRLDRDTSGVALFAKHPDANAGLAAAFGNRRVVKVYHALTVRPLSLPPARWTLEGRLGVIGSGRRAKVGSVAEGGDVARTDFTLLETLRSALLIEARPRTGRKHQIRAQLAEAGLAILGDTRYSGRAPCVLVPRLMLHACRLELVHPVTGEPLAVESAYPEDFKRTLAHLRRTVPSSVGQRRRSRRRVPRQRGGRQ
jgi:23S rRNA pseudouridine1911/1915/1917 synthase